MSIISDTEAIRYILMGANVQARNRHPRYACYVGAGVSIEAGVKAAGQICDQIREDLIASAQLSEPDDEDQIRELEETLRWGDPSLRYMSCIKEAYPDPAMRVEYFRGMLRGAAPSFAHHALALLVKHRYLRSTCLTTNFDKLLESAFIQQGGAECQPIRTDDEIRYWEKSEDRHYVIKLHGDYDTHNVSNTSEETVTISEGFQSAVWSLLEFAGLIVIGTAGYEKSVHTMFDLLSKKALADGKVLKYGLLWGVYVGPSKPKGITRAEVERLIKERLDRGDVSGDVRRMIERSSRQRLFCFFPVWGAANFMYDLIKTTRNRELVGTAERYLDRGSRLIRVFSGAGLSEEAIKKHLSTLEPKRTYLSDGEGESQTPERICKAVSRSGRVDVNVFYGDITSRTFMGSDEFKAARRAVISPDDTFITAGGGVAEGLLAKAGRQFILNELAKFSPIPQGEVAVTSGGNLPVHFLFHAAAIKVEQDASYSVSRQSVYDAMTSALAKASALEVGALWVPLMGTGAAGLPPKEAFEGILEAIRDWERAAATPIVIMIFIYKFSVLEKSEANQSMQTILRKSRFKSM